MANLDETLDAAIAHHQQGRLSDAETLYRQVIDTDSRHPDALYLLGRLVHEQGRYDQAASLIRRAIASAPAQPTFHHHLGEALWAQGSTADAISAYRKALSLDPHYAVAYSNLAKALEAAGAATEAEAAFREALRIRPAFPEALNNLGMLLNRQQRWREARACFEAAIGIKPDLVESHNNLGNALRGEGRLTEAVDAYRRAIDLNANYAPAYFNLGVALVKCGRLHEALTAYQHAIRIRDDDFEAIGNLGAVLNDLGYVSEAIAAYRLAIALNSEDYVSHGNLGVCLQSLGRLDEAIAAYRTATRLCPQNAAQHSNLLYVLNYHPGYDAATIFAEHLAWARQHAEGLTAAAAAHANDRSPTRRLRVGYVSPHFRRHAVNSFTEGILASHDHAAFEIFCYSDVASALGDAKTARLQGYADCWRDIANRDDQHVSDMIRSDEIDILVDLCGHIGGNRLLVFARKPAPVQVTYLGYQNTTGMRAMDYRLTDAWADPPGATDPFYTEQLIRLPNGFFCYLPGEEAPRVSDLPAAANGYVTFGSFNSFAKVTPQVLATWAEIMSRVPRSRLVLLAPRDESLRVYVHECFERHGIPCDRIELCEPRPVAEYLELVGRADLALDAFPFNGHTTTCDALWQGVGVVMLAGNSYASRFGSTALKQLGLDDFIADTTAQYIEIAVRLANDRQRMEALRTNLRELMRHSPMLDTARFTKNLEAAYRGMWATWCASQPHAADLSGNSG